jgi:hypothetical protein
MGSDDGDDGSRPRRRKISHYHLLLRCLPFLGRGYPPRRNCPILIVPGVLILTVVVGFAVFSVVPPPEVVFTDTFTERQRRDLPVQCIYIARQFDRSQRLSLESAAGELNSATTANVVFACHRRWCGSYWGHCEPCAGIGDRTRFLLSQVQEAMMIATAGRLDDEDHGNNVKTKRVHIWVDAPPDGLAIARNALYTEGWLAELLHYRSYDVSTRKALVFDHLLENSGDGNTYHYTHFTPDAYFLNENYNACYFHVLFQPAPSLRRELERHNDAIAPQSIGIHYRTGDAAAFGIANQDNRLAGSAMEGWKRLEQCAVELAAKLFPDTSLSDVTLYLATDHSGLKKELWRQQQIQTHLQQQRRPQLYLTDVHPDSYLRGNSGDREAWMEIFLLAARQGLVANVLPKRYQGTAKHMSQFAILAQKIGFMTDDQVVGCSID